MFENLVWEQRYRPKKIDDTILPPTTKKMLNEIIKTGNIPNMMFAGSGGIGKCLHPEYNIEVMIDIDTISDETLKTIIQYQVT
jgi:hypothetical protein